ncbi:MAG: sulfotransferase domain-containing protein [Actinomycetota bacterium]|nr:sulfotransferase domain-containing protein [Actinomycetota bacterium]
MSRARPGQHRPPACPSGWRTGPPDFVGVGVQKAGTSWWYSLLAMHPQVAPRPDHRKELHFFDCFSGQQFGSADAARYHEFFPRPDGALAGEWTPRYLSDFWTPRQLAIAAPDAKLLVLLRDPVDRYRSGITHELNLGARRNPTLAIEVMHRGMYHLQLTALLRHFPREQVLVLQYEQCRDDPQRQLARTFDFLGLDPMQFIPSDLSKRVNVTPTEKLLLPAQVSDELQALYSPDVLALAEEFPEIDVRLWPNFRDRARRLRRV